MQFAVDGSGDLHRPEPHRADLTIAMWLDRTVCASSSSSAVVRPSTRCRASRRCTCLRAADPDRFDVVPIGITRDGRWIESGDAIAVLSGAAAALPSPDDSDASELDPLPAIVPAEQDASEVVVFPLVHGPMGEDGTVQGLLELAGVPYVGAGVLGSALCMDKSAAKDVLAAHGLPQAKWLTAREQAVDDAFTDRAVDELGLPVFVKPANLGSSVGVTKAHDHAELRDALAEALRYDEYVIVEEAVIGREIEVAVLGNSSPRASVPGEIVPSHEFYDFDDKYLDGSAGLRIPAPLSDDATQRVRHLAVEAYPRAARRRHGPRRLLLRGERPRLSRQRAEHHPRVHADLDVPEAVGGVGASVRRARRRARAPRPRAARTPLPLRHQALN